MTLAEKNEIVQRYEDKRRLDAVKDGNAFREYVIRDDRSNMLIQQSDIHRSWISHIERCEREGKHCAILAPWGSGKSVNITIGESLRRIGKNPSIRIKIVNALDQFSVDRVKAIRRYIDDDENYRRLYPNVRRDDTQQWTQHRIYLSRKSNAIDPSIEAKGLFSKGISGRADVLIFDDPVDDSSIFSEVTREAARAAYRNVWMSRLTDTGFVIYIATRWADEDLTQTIIDSGKYLVLIQRVSEDFERIEQEILCGKDTEKLPDLPPCDFWNPDALKRRFDEIGSRAFNRGFRQRAISEGELTFPHFAKCVRYDEPIPARQSCVIGVDLSTDIRKGTVIFTLGKTANVKYPLEIRSGAWSSTETAENIRDMHAKWNPAVIAVENNAYQEALIDWLRTKGFEHLPVIAHTTGRNKSDAEIGLPALDVQFERGLWQFYIPKHQAGCQCEWCRCYREFVGHPAYSSTDIVMAAWIASRAADQYLRTSSLDTMASSGKRKESPWNKNF